MNSNKPLQHFGNSEKYALSKIDFSEVNTFEQRAQVEKLKSACLAKYHNLNPANTFHMEGHQTNGSWKERGAGHSDFLLEFFE